MLRRGRPPTIGGLGGFDERRRLHVAGPAGGHPRHFRRHGLPVDGRARHPPSAGRRRGQPGGVDLRSRPPLCERVASSRTAAQGRREVDRRRRGDAPGVRLRLVHRRGHGGRDRGGGARHRLLTGAGARRVGRDHHRDGPARAVPAPVPRARPRRRPRPTGGGDRRSRCRGHHPRGDPGPGRRAVPRQGVPSPAGLGRRRAGRDPLRPRPAPRGGRRPRRRHHRRDLDEWRRGDDRPRRTALRRGREDGRAPLQLPAGHRRRLSGHRHLHRHPRAGGRGPE